MPDKYNEMLVDNLKKTSERLEKEQRKNIARLIKGVWGIDITDKNKNA